MACGVYAIESIVSDMRYIGSTNNSAIRWQQHRSGLNLNKHHCMALQEAWNDLRTFICVCLA